MRRLQFSKEEFVVLEGHLNSLYNANKHPYLWLANDLLQVLYSVPAGSCTSYEHKWIYESIRNATIERIWQVIYHTPLEDIPLLINDKHPVVVAIALWRLEIAR